MNHSRGHLLLAGVLSLGCLFNTSGCFAPEIPDNLVCGVGGECPPGQHCEQANNTCVDDGTPPVQIDASIPDAMLAPPELTLDVAAELSGCAEIPYELRDRASRRIDLRFELRADQHADSIALTPAGSDPGEPSFHRVLSSPDGMSHAFHWNSTRDLPRTDTNGVLLVHVLAAGSPEQVVEAPIRVRNADSPPCDPGLGPTEVSPVEGAYQGVTLDFDDDGKLDLVAVDGHALSVILGRGDGHFDHGPTLEMENLVTVASADLDQDGSPDFVTTTFHTVTPPAPEDPETPPDEPYDVATINVVGKDAEGLHLATAITTTATRLTAVAGDVDGDGDADIVALDASGKISIYSNVSPSTLSFAPAQSIVSSQAFNAVAIRDLDLDGLPELVATYRYGIHVFHQRSTLPGLFTIEDEFEVPIGDPRGGLIGTAFGDINHDNTTDILASAEKGGLVVFAQIAGAHGRQFELETGADIIDLRGAPPKPHGLVYRADVPGAALILETDHMSYAWSAGDAAPTFDHMMGLGPPGNLVPGDFDGDGLTDVAHLAGTISVSLARSENHGFSTPLRSPQAGQRDPDEYLNASAPGKLGGMGTGIATSYSGKYPDPGQLRVFRQGGSANFDEGVDLMTSAKGIQAGDLDHDGLDDLVLTVPGLRIRIQGGDGVWEEEKTLSGIDEYDPSLVATIADLDQDDLNDIILRDYVSIRWLKNLGNGDFAAPVTLMDGQPTSVVTVARLDGDDRVDLVVWDETGLLVMLQSPDHAGEFLPPVRYDHFGIEDPFVVMDVDRDGHLDIVAGSAFGSDPQWLRGSPAGDGTFLAPQTLIEGAGRPVALETADVNGDGCPDLVVDSGLLSVYLADCSVPGTFSGRLDSFGIRTSARSYIHSADLDADGNDELVVTSVYDLMVLKARQ